MKFLPYIPDANGFSHKPSGSVASRVEVEGGPDVRRQDLLGLTTLFEVSFTVGSDEAQSVGEFVDAYFADPQWFHILLIGLPHNAAYPLNRYAVQIIPGSYKLGSVDGNRYAIQMSLEGYLDDPIPTSFPYQRLFTEAIDFGFEMSGAGGLNQGLWTDGLELDFVMTGTGELRVAFDGTYESSEELVFAFEMGADDGLLKVVYISYDAKSEDLAFTFEMAAPGSLQVVYILYDKAEPEGLDISFEMDGVGELA